MVEFVALALAVAVIALIWLVAQQQARLKQAETLLSSARIPRGRNATTSPETGSPDEVVVTPPAAVDTPAPVSPDTHAASRSALLSLLADSSEEILLIVDDQLKIVAQNSATVGVFPDTAIGMSLDETTVAPSLLALVENTFAYGDEMIEEQVVVGDHTFLVRISQETLDGRKFASLALQDITQLVRLNRARRDMVANISHELRHPIANIRLIIDGLFHDHDKPKRKESISSLRAIAHETDLLLWLVQSMADLSMIESGQAIVKMVDTNFNDLVDGAIERLENQTERKHLKIVKHVPAKLHVLCDRDLVQRVVINLLHNAIKWSPEGGAVTIAAEISGEEIVVSVLDNGPGVPSDQTERIFERFYQVDPSRSGKDGTGLGLAICKHIVTAHGGRIWAEGNRMGGGGKFRFTLLNADLTYASPINGSTTVSMP